ncbi:MAG: hypothetical protein OEY44_00185 [Candidatus Peregrinibacteria bacterium]|nr:hypothetical protein [Candidatus Peregrinibacteria bacterium]
MYHECSCGDSCDPCDNCDSPRCECYCDYEPGSEFKDEDEDDKDFDW